MLNSIKKIIIPIFVFVFCSIMCSGCFLINLIDSFFINASFHESSSINFGVINLNSNDGENFVYDVTGSFNMNDMSNDEFMLNYELNNSNKFNIYVISQVTIYQSLQDDYLDKFYVTYLDNGTCITSQTPQMFEMEQESNRNIEYIYNSDILNVGEIYFNLKVVAVNKANLTSEQALEILTEKLEQNA